MDWHHKGQTLTDMSLFDDLEPTQPGNPAVGTPLADRMRPSTIDDLRDGGLGQVRRAIGILKRRNLLH